MPVTESNQPGNGIVAAAIVDANDLVGHPQSLDGRDQPLEERAEILGLVEHRHDHR
jgi:hypothetical protein